MMGDMSDPITIPPPDAIVRQIHARRAEIAELKKLLRFSQAAAQARKAQSQQAPLPNLLARKGGSGAA
jgi:hypothetical protein